MNGTIIPHTPIAVDFWRIRNCPNAQVFFLTHLHADHISGLTPTWSLPIYCTPISKKLLVHKLQIREDLIHELAPNASHTVWLDEAEREMMTVTVIDAHHCPGAAMFLFQGYFGNILHTGDFRYSDKMFINTPLSNPPSIDVLYLDNTYSSPECEFPTRRQAMEQVFETLDQYPDHDVLVGMRSLGKEDLLVAMAFHMRTWVVVSQEQYELLSILDMPNVFTTDPEAGHIHVIPMRQIVPTLRNWNYQRPTIAIIPTALHFGSANMYGSVENAFVVPYSDHSSYSEIQRFVVKVRPRKIIPVVDAKARGPRGEDISGRADMSRYKKYMDPRAVAPFKIPRSVEAFMRKTHPVIKMKRPVSRKRSNVLKTVAKKRAKFPRGVEFEDSDDFDETPNLDTESQSSCPTQGDIGSASEFGFDSSLKSPDDNWHLIPIDIPKEQQQSIWKNIPEPRLYFEKLNAKSDPDDHCKNVDQQSEISSPVFVDETEVAKTPPYIHDKIASPMSGPEHDIGLPMSQPIHQELEESTVTAVCKFRPKSPYCSPSTQSSTGYKRIGLLREGPGSAESVCRDSDAETPYPKVHAFDDAVFTHEEIDFVDSLRFDTANVINEQKNQFSTHSSIGENEQAASYSLESAIYPEPELGTSIKGNVESGDSGDKSATIDLESQGTPSEAGQSVNTQDNHRLEDSPEQVELLDEDQDIINSLILTPVSQVPENDIDTQDDMPIAPGVCAAVDNTPVQDITYAPHSEHQELENQINVQYTQQDVFTDANVCVANADIPTTDTQVMVGDLTIPPSDSQILQVSEYINLDVNSSQFFTNGTEISAGDFGLCVTDGEIVIHESEGGSKIDVCVSSNHPLGEHTVLSQHVPYSLNTSLDVTSSLTNNALPIILNQTVQGTAIPTEGLDAVPGITHQASQSACTSTESAIPTLSTNDLGNIEIELQSNGGQQAQNTVFTIDVDTLNSLLLNQPAYSDNTPRQHPADVTQGEGGQTVTFTVDNALASGGTAGAPPVSLIVDPQITARGPEAVSQELNRLTSELMDRINEALQGAGNQHDANPDNMAEAFFGQSQTAPDIDQQDKGIDPVENNTETLKDDSARSRRQYRVTLREKSQSEKYFVWGPTSGRSSWQLRGKKRTYDPTRILKEENVGLPGGLALAGTSGSYSRWDEEYKTRVNTKGHRKQRGWPKGKPRGPRKKETIYPVEQVRPKGRQIKLVIKLGKAPKTLLSERKDLHQKLRKPSNSRTLEQQGGERASHQQPENKSIFELLAEICPSWSGSSKPNTTLPGMEVGETQTSLEPALFIQETMDTSDTATGNLNTGSPVTYTHDASSNMDTGHSEHPSVSYEPNIENNDAQPNDQDNLPIDTAETNVTSVDQLQEEADPIMNDDISQDLDTTSDQGSDNGESQKVTEEASTVERCNSQEPNTNIMSDETLSHLESQSLLDQDNIHCQELIQSEIIQGSPNNLCRENGRTAGDDCVSEISPEENAQEQQSCTAKEPENADRTDAGLEADNHNGNISDQQSWVTCYANHDVANMSDLSSPYNSSCGSPLQTQQETSCSDEVGLRMDNHQKDDSNNKGLVYVHLSLSDEENDTHRSCLTNEANAAPTEPPQGQVDSNDKQDKEESKGSPDLSSRKDSSEAELKHNSEDIQQVPSPNHLQDNSQLANADSPQHEVPSSTGAPQNPDDLIDSPNLSQTDMPDTSCKETVDKRSDTEPITLGNKPTDSENTVSDNEQIESSTSLYDTCREYNSAEENGIQRDCTTTKTGADQDAGTLEEEVGEDDRQEKEGSQILSDIGETEKQDDNQDELDENRHSSQSADAEVPQDNHSPATGIDNDAGDSTERLSSSSQSCHVISGKESDCYQICSTDPTAFGERAHSANTPSSVNEERFDSSIIICPQEYYKESSSCSFRKKPRPSLKLQRKTKLKGLSLSKVVSTSIGNAEPDTNGESDSDDVVIIWEGFEGKERRHYNNFQGGFMSPDHEHRSTPLSCVSTESNVSQRSSRIPCPTPEKMDIFDITPVEAATIAGEKDSEPPSHATQTPGQSEQQNVLGYIIQQRRNSDQSVLGSVEVGRISPLSSATDDVSVSSMSYVVGYNDRSVSNPLPRISSRKPNRTCLAERQSSVIAECSRRKRTIQTCNLPSGEQGKSCLQATDPIGVLNYPHGSLENTDSERNVELKESLTVLSRSRKCKAKPESDRSNICTSYDESGKFKDLSRASPMTEIILDNDPTEPSTSFTDSTDKFTKLLQVNSKALFPRYRVVNKQKVPIVQKTAVQLGGSPRARYPTVNKANVPRQGRNRAPSYKVTLSPRIMYPIVHNVKVIGNVVPENVLRQKGKDRINVTLTDGERFDVMGATPKYTTQFTPDVEMD